MMLWFCGVSKDTGDGGGHGARSDGTMDGIDGSDHPYLVVAIDLGAAIGEGRWRISWWWCRGMDVEFKPR